MPVARMIASWMNASRVKRHANYITSPVYEECSYVLQLPRDLRCEFVTNTNSCSELTFKIDCANFIFCQFEEGPYWFPILVLCVVGLFLVYLVNLFITETFTATTLAIGRKLDLNECLTGIIVITIADTSYNFFELFYILEQNTGLVYNATVGTALINFGILIPIIMLMRPHKMIKHYIIIDTVFVVANFVWLHIYYAGQSVSYLKAGCLAFGYVFYVIILWIDARIMLWKFTFYTQSPEKMEELLYARTPFKIFSNFNNMQKITDDEDKAMVKATRFATWFEPAVRGPANQFIFKQFKDDLLDFKYSDVSTFIKIKRIIDTPFVILLRFVTPVINLSKPCHKWSKLLRVINVIFYPMLCWYAVGLPTENYLYVFYATLVLAIIIFFTSRTDRSPPYYFVYGVFVFIGYTFITFGIMTEVENIMSSVFMLMHFEVETTGHLAIAIFDVIPDVSLAINLVQRGYPKIAWAGSFATVIFRGYFEMGIRFIVRRWSGDTSKIRSGSMGPTGGIFGILLMLLMYTGLKTTNFFTRRAIAIFMILAYVTFFVFSLLVDNGLAHGYATTHLNENAIEEDLLQESFIALIPKGDSVPS